jgi:serine/threonine protein kinase
MTPTTQEPSADAAKERYRPGDVVADRYVLVRKLGEGGMGVVWVARSKALDVDVALKLLRGSLAGTDAVERMAREARAAAQLGHPALVRVLDFGETEHGEPFLAMELLQGDELSALLEKEHRIAAVRAVGLLLPIVDGLATAHEKGIVHRDIKPENVFIARDDQGRLQPKLLDFGIAKLGRGEAVSRLTQYGAVLGSPVYLSPEQAEGVEDVDFRTDIWSIGVMLYELIAGEAPFSGQNYNALIRSITRDAPKPTTEHKAGDARLWVIIARCLKKEPAERWGSMWELGEALALWLFEQGIRVDASSRSLRDGWLDGSVTGVRVIVASAFPSADLTTLPPVTPSLSPSSPSSENRALPAERVDTLSRSAEARPRSRAPVAMLAVLVLALVGGAGLFVGRRGAMGAAAQNEAPSGIVATPSPGAKEASQTPVLKGVQPPAPGAASGAPSSPSAPEASASSVVPPKPLSVSAAKAHGAIAAPTTVAPAGVHPRKHAHSAVDTEFGF